MSSPHLPFSTENVSSADNQQETLSLSHFYFTGFCCGEISVSLIKEKTNTGSGYKYVPDITISNADYSLLQKVNEVVGQNTGILSPIKGGFNLSFRRKRKVKLVLEFFKKYPPIAGNLIQSRLALIQTALYILEIHHGRSRTPYQTRELEKIRFWLKQIKREGKSFFEYPQSQFSESAIGYFLAGILDAEGSVGMKSNGSVNGQPFIALAMKDKKIVELFQRFCRSGKVRFRPNDQVYHFEIGSKSKVDEILTEFGSKHPFRLPKMQKRVTHLQRILNDYTPGLSLNERMI